MRSTPVTAAKRSGRPAGPTTGRGLQGTMHVLTTLADEPGVARAPAAARVHRRDQHEAGGISTRESHFAGFERLPQ